MMEPLPPSRWALLKHELVDGSWHLDWLLERPSVIGGGVADDRVLIAWRLAAELGEGWRPNQGLGGELGGGGEQIQAERLPDHRRLYLDFEGSIGGGRGSVRRLDSGLVSLLQESAGRMEFEVGAVVAAEGVARSGKRPPEGRAAARWIANAQTTGRDGAASGERWLLSRSVAETDLSVGTPGGR